MWRGVEKAKQAARQAYGNVRYLSSFLRLHPRIENCRLAEQKHENESSTRHGQRNYHIVSQLVRRGKCMQQFINHEAPYGRGERGVGERQRQQELIIFCTGHKERKRSKQRQKGNYANAN